MSVKYLKFFIGLFLLSSPVFSQTIISGKVMDAASKEPVPFASIGIKGSPYGTVCDENGNFELIASQIKDEDSLKIASIGYSSRSIVMAKARNFKQEQILLKAAAVQLSEVQVKPGKIIRKKLGNSRYNKNVFCSFSGVEGNYKGAEAAIRAKNKKGRFVWIEDFSFYILKNMFNDSISFRLNFYNEDAQGMPGQNILKKPIVFKTRVKEGLVFLDLKQYTITADGDFFISLECLEGKMDKDKLNFSGSISGPSYFKLASFADWIKSPLMGLDFNVTVSYQK